jgi:hypothetical protein
MADAALRVAAPSPTFSVGSRCYRQSVPSSSPSDESQRLRHRSRSGLKNLAAGNLRPKSGVIATRLLSRPSFDLESVIEEQVPKSSQVPFGAGWANHPPALEELRVIANRVDGDAEG